MNKHWDAYMRLGINHHLLFPQTFESVDDHVKTLPFVLEHPAFEVVDMFILQGGGVEEAERAMVLESGKEPVYNCPLMTGEGRNPHHPDAAVRAGTLQEVLMHAERARRLGARKMVIASGIDPGAEQRAEQTDYFIDYLAELCTHVPELLFLIEPFDRSIGKNLMVGPSLEAVSIIGAVHERGAKNLGILMDMGHVPLMEETFEHALAVCAPYIQHIHLGSCVMSNPSNPLYGDMHPPWGYPDGENDVPELVAFLKGLFQIGYLADGKRPTVTLEMRPYPDKSESESIGIFIAKLDEAWQQLEL
ncbi:Sugar phosphate isomerase/epimerase [Paenibacillus sp. UNCCL117]|uniref:sugar phosphate isomerase/epimerase family protein n=1 Tax=unclassified Paenibacillus TaxID=185978 RepID=UPI000884556C|nr:MULTISPECIES: TIM barrel protein [unclassified Paenibacillus]SDD02403.1 Sugar phosphate isomerase/epimerase [Paenibacillus sp. cl123]SFW32494.1 Sugar phosphate isomerase/epimerase [Paenibacillus sp. UNCCL117]